MMWMWETVSCSELEMEKLGNERQRRIRQRYIEMYTYVASRQERDAIEYARLLEIGAKKCKGGWI